MKVEENENRTAGRHLLMFYPILVEKLSFHFDSCETKVERTQRYQLEEEQIDCMKDHGMSAIGINTNHVSSQGILVSQRR